MPAADMTAQQLQFTTADANGQLVDPISTPVVVKRRLFDDDDPLWNSDYQNLTGILPLPELTADCRGHRDDRLRGGDCTFTDLTSATDGGQTSVTGGTTIDVEQTRSATDAVHKEPTDEKSTQQKHLNVNSFYGLQRPNCTSKTIKWFNRNDGKRQYKKSKVLPIKLKSSISQLRRKMRNKFIFFKAADVKKKPKTFRKRPAKKNMPPLNRYPLMECIPMLKTFDKSHQKETVVNVENESFEENWNFFNLPGPSQENKDNGYCTYDPLLGCDFSDADDEFAIPSIDTIIENLFKDDSDWQQNDNGIAFDFNYLQDETSIGGQTISLSSSTTEVLSDELEELQIANVYQENDNAPLSGDYLNL